MSKSPRGADLVADALVRAGTRKVFSLSGNHIMSIYDAMIGRPLDIVHVRHEAAAVHMADAWGRMTRQPGVAMVTGGPGHANAVGALYTALCAESPMVLLSGHAGLNELGRGGFQEIRQADMATPVAKASWMATSAADLGNEVARAFDIAVSGRPGPVHLSLPSDLLDEVVSANVVQAPRGAGAADIALLHEGLVAAVLDEIGRAKRPLVLAAPAFAHEGGRRLLGDLEAALGVPVVIMEAVRGIKDATLGAFPDVLKQADLIVLLAKSLDFTLGFGEAPAVDPACRFIALDPEGAMLDRARRAKGERLVLSALAEGRATAERLAKHDARHAHHEDWRAEARRLMTKRPTAWATTVSATPGRLHPLEVFRALRPIVERDGDTLLVCDGGEFSQWGQSMLPARRRMINSVAGAIGSGIPAAIAARTVDARAPIIAVMGDGTFGFHMSEFDTAVRERLAFVAVVGNDARWNAEHQIQVRDYGADRTIGCELAPTRYDQVVTALGGYGEMVDNARDVGPAIERALASGKPACINIMTESIPAPLLKAADLG